MSVQYTQLAAAKSFVNQNKFVPVKNIRSRSTEVGKVTFSYVGQNVQRGSSVGNIASQQTFSNKIDLKYRFSSDRA